MGSAGNNAGTSSPAVAKFEPKRNEVPISAQNPGMQVTPLDLALLVSLAQRHFDLIASSKTCKLCFANVNQLQTWEQDTVSTVAQTRGAFLDIAFSPFFANYIAAVTDQGEAIVKDITQSRSTFHIAPSLAEGPKPFLKLNWHTSRQTVLATAYQDGLVCVWDMSIATQNPKSVVDGVTTLERPSTTGIVYNDSPELLVAMRSPEPIVDMTMAGEYVFTVGISGSIRVFDTRRGSLVGEIANAAAKRVIVVSEAPFVIATSSGTHCEKTCLWRLQSASPLRFAMTEYFEFAPVPLPDRHPGRDASFHLMRMASKNMLIVSHPYMAALWILSIDGSRAFTFGTAEPFAMLTSHDPAEGFVGICNSTVVFAKFSGPTDPQVTLPIVTQQVLTASSGPSVVTVEPAPITPETIDIPESPSVLAAAAAKNAAAGEDQGPMITLDALKGILMRQNEICLEGLRNNRALTLKKQLHVLECLKNLPSAIMDALTPVLDTAAAAQQGRTDSSGIANAVAEAVKEPATAAFGSYFKESLIPGYTKACNFMVADIQDAVDSGAKNISAAIGPAYTASVIEPLVQGLANASGKLTQVYSKAQSNGTPSTANTTTNSTTQTSAPVVSNVTATTTTSNTSTAEKAPAQAPVVTPAPTVTPAATPAKKQKTKSVSTPQASPAPASTVTTSNTSAVSNAAPAAAVAPAAAAVAAVSSSTTSSNNSTTHAPTPVHAKHSDATTSSTGSLAPPSVEATPSPPRPEPKPTAPISDATRGSLTTLINQKQWTEAVNIVLDVDNVEALGYLTSRTDMGWWVDDIPQTHLEVLLFMILKQTEWPSASQLAKYKKTVLLILAKLNPTTLSNSPTTHEMLKLAVQWVSGTPIEASAREQVDRLTQGIPK